MRFLFCTVPLIGHVAPGLPIARALVERGHEVRWYTGRNFRPRVEATGARFESMRAAPDVDEEDLEAAFPGISRHTGLDAFKFGVKHVFVDPAPAQVEDLERILAEFPADALVSDTAFVGALFLVERRGGPPRAVYGISALPLPSRDTAPFGLGLPPVPSAPGRLRNRALHTLFNWALFRDVEAHYNGVRARVGLPPSRAGILSDSLNSQLYLQGTVARFEYPRSDLPTHVHFIGAFLPGPAPGFAPPAWWCDLHAGRPVVHVTQGTATTAPDQLLIPTLRALADEEVLVVATTGGKPVEMVGLDPLPANARVERFIPHYHLLPHVDVIVTNGGYGGTHIALANGVPLVAAGRTEEKPEVCARIAWSGAGIDLRTNRPASARIRAAVRAVLTDPRYRRAALRLAGDLARHDAPAEAAALLERLAATRRPVLATPTRAG
ncbi:MAG: glycosyltransferase, putative [uncultured Thermomicrobiales bacterium]|uniref:Glycosyltransferase, putative n=1 Tax=uncultured Thermomicrobiales bacterium TaxID=1645740 RepID=A0A6J4V4M5_9BACT|nr:MAG: glycosyltransferase, putative [uncultured Thermomicrobiales bacterium]